MNVRARVPVLAAALSSILCGCSGAIASLPQVGVAPVGVGDGMLPEKAGPQKVYWTLFASPSYPQVQFTKVPLTKKSKAANVGSGSGNDLTYTSGMAVDSAGRLWILSFGQYGGGPTSVLVFKLPMTDTSAPLYTFVLAGTSGSDALAFDPSGNLWVTSPGNHEIMKYAAPFKKSGRLKPAKTLNGGPFRSYGIAFDSASNLYVSIADSTGTDSIGVAKPPYARKDTYFLNGLSSPGGLIFDRAGNLYASGKAASGEPAVVRYDSNDLKNGDTPSIVDSTGLPGESYEAAFAFSANGDLYAANCGSGSAGIDVYPTSKKQFNSKLAPSVEYTNADITEAGCAWGIAIE